MTIDKPGGNVAKQHSSLNIQHWLALSLVFLLCALCIFSHSVSESVDHDEHQFVASAAILARRGLLPYRDYPYLHTPYLVFADGLLFRSMGSSTWLLLMARLLSAACGFATVALLASAVASLYRDLPPTTGSCATILAMLLLVTNPLFAAVTGLAWNHDSAELFLVAATLLFLGDVHRGSYTARSMLATGALLGLSIGIRLTVAPAVAAFAGWVLADTRFRSRRRLEATCLLLLGLIIALAPCGWLLLQSPQGFVFGNFEYPTLNTAYRIAHGSMTDSTTPLGKITYFLSRVVFSSGTGFLLMLIALTIWLRRAKRLPASDLTPVQNPPTPGRSGPGPHHPSHRATVSAHQGRAEMKFLGLLILFLLAGSFAPAPMFIVYFYAPVPFAVLWLAYAWRGVMKSNWPKAAVWQHGAAGVLALCCLVCGIPAYRHLPAVVRLSRWIPLEVHNSGVALRGQLASAGAPAGPVLTLAPIIPLEGGLDIYEPFATGPFAFRAAPMVPATERRALHLVDEHDLSQLLKGRPPMAVLFNVEQREEEAPMLRAVPKGCVMVRLVHGSSFSLSHNATGMEDR